MDISKEAIMGVGSVVKQRIAHHLPKLASNMALGLAYNASKESILDSAYYKVNDLTGFGQSRSMASTVQKAVNEISNTSPINYETGGYGSNAIKMVGGACYLMTDPISTALCLGGVSLGASLFGSKQS